MRLSKNKIKQLLNVKNQSQKRAKKTVKMVGGAKKTMGRKKPVNLRNKTLKQLLHVGGADLTEAEYTEATTQGKQLLTAELRKFIELKDNLTYDTIDSLQKVSSEINKATTAFLLLHKKLVTREDIQNSMLNVNKSARISKVITEFKQELINIKKLKSQGKSEKIVKEKKVKLIIRKFDKLLTQLQRAFTQVPELKNVYNNAIGVAPEPEAEGDEENLRVEAELAKMQAEEEGEGEGEESQGEEAELASGFAEADTNVQLTNAELRNNLEQKMMTLKYCAETDKDKDNIDEILEVMKATKEESALAEGEKLHAVEEKVNELSQKPCDPLVEIQNHLLIEISKLEEEKDEPLTDAEYKKLVLIKDTVEKSIKNRENIANKKKDKEKEIAKLTEMLQEIFTLSNAYNLRLNNAKEILTGFEDAEKARQEKILAEGEFLEEGELPNVEEEPSEKEASTPNKELNSLRNEIISLLENNPDIAIDKLKYGEIEESVKDWAHKPDAEELENFKAFRDYLREQIKTAGQEMFGDIAAEDFEDFEQAINDTQVDFNQLPDVFTDDDKEQYAPPPTPPPPPPPLFVEEAKERLDPAELEEIVRKRMTELEEQYKQDKVNEADVIAKYEGIVKNMQEDDRLKYQNFIEGVRTQWNNTIKSQEAERETERELLYNVLNQNEDTIKTLQDELAEKQKTLELNEQIEQVDNEMIDQLRAGIDDIRQKLRGKSEELIKATEEWNKKYEEAEAARQENIDELTTQLKEQITLSGESKEKLENMLAERNAVILKGREDLKKQEELSAKLTKRIEELERSNQNKDELPNWDELDAVLKANIKKNKATLDDQEQIKRRLAERIAQFENDPKYAEQVKQSREQLAELESESDTETEPETETETETELASEKEKAKAKEELPQFENPAFGLKIEEEDEDEDKDEDEDETLPTSTSAPTSVQTTTTEIRPGRNGIQEILVRIQYPPGTTNPGPVMSFVGDTSVSTEAAVVGVMGEHTSSTVEPPIAINPGFSPPESSSANNNPFAGGGGKTSNNKNKTTRRKKNMYFTKDDFIAF